MIVRRSVVFVAALALLSVSCGSSDGSSGSAASSGEWTPAQQPAVVTVEVIDDVVPVEVDFGAEEVPSWVVPWKGGFMAVQAIPQATPFPELTEEQQARLPDEVLELFEGDPPETVSEAIGRVLDAGLDAMMTAFFQHNDDLYELIMENSTPDLLEAWTTDDGVAWTPAGYLEPPEEEQLWEVLSDGEWLVLHGEATLYATPDLIEWTELPITVPTQPWSPESMIDVGHGGWAAVVSASGTSTALLADWGEEPVEVELPGWVSRGELTRTPTGAVVIVVHGNGSQRLYSVGPESLEATRYALPDDDFTSMWGVESGVLLLNGTGLYLSEDDGATWSPLEIPDFPSSALQYQGWFLQPDPGHGYAGTPFVEHADSETFGPGAVIVATPDAAEWLIHDGTAWPSTAAGSPAVLGYDRVLVWSDTGALLFDL